MRKPNAQGRESRNYHWLQWNRNSQRRNACRRIPRTCLPRCRHCFLCSLIFDKSFIWFEETIYCRLLEILSFLELVLLIMRTFVASGMFVSPILVKAISFFSFYRSLWTKAARSLSLFPRRHGNSAKILLRGLAVTKLRVETRMVCKLTDCHSDLPAFH